MREFLISILFRLLKIPIPTVPIDKKRMSEWIGLQYPRQEFQDYIASRNFHILQMLGEGIPTGPDAWMYVGQRIELGHLLTEGKKNFTMAEKKRKQANENAKNKKG